MNQDYFTFLYVVSQTIIPHFYVLGFRMEHWVLCNTYGTGAITLKWDMGILLTKVTHGVCDPNELRATTSCGNVLCPIVDHNPKVRKFLRIYDDT
jgi:hypothetical protein